LSWSAPLTDTGLRVLASTSRRFTTEHAAYSGGNRWIASHTALAVG
jgi:hypothetical protein